MKKLLLSLALIFVFTGFASADPILGPSVWRDRHGSTLRIKSVAAGFFSGTYINRAPATYCKHTPYMTSGMATPVGFSFSVNFAKCYTVTNWTGNVSGNGRIMTTSFQMLYTPPGKPTQVIPGTDIFRRIR